MQILKCTCKKYNNRIKVCIVFVIVLRRLSRVELIALCGPDLCLLGQQVTRVFRYF